MRGASLYYEKTKRGKVPEEKQSLGFSVWGDRESLQYEIGIWSAGSDNVGFMHITKAPKGWTLESVNVQSGKAKQRTLIRPHPLSSLVLTANLLSSYPQCPSCHDQDTRTKHPAA